MNTHLILGLIGAGSELFDWAGLGYSKPGVRNGEIGLSPLSENATEKGEQIMKRQNVIGSSLLVHWQGAQNGAFNLWCLASINPINLLLFKGYSLSKVFIRVKTKKKSKILKAATGSLQGFDHSSEVPHVFNWQTPTPF